MFVILVFGATLIAAAQSPPTTKGIIIGTWVKDHTQMECSDYPGDQDWQLEVTFAPDGTFIWQSTRTVRGSEAVSNQVAQIDDSIKGKYVMGGYLITYQFDSPSEQAMKQLPYFFAFWPRQLRGQHTFSFRDGFLCLGNDGEKTWIFLKRKAKKDIEMVLPSCTSTQSTRQGRTFSESQSISESQALSDETKARLKIIQEEYGVMGMFVTKFVTNTEITVTIGMIPPERVKAMKKAILEIVGDNFTIGIIRK